MPEESSSETRKWRGTPPPWLFVLVFTLLAWGCVVLAVRTSLWIGMSVLFVLTFPFSLRHLRTLPLRRAFFLSASELALAIGFGGLMLLGWSSRYGWIQTTAEVGGGLYLLFDISTWRRRRARAGRLILRVPRPWWFVPTYAYMAMTAVLTYFVAEFPAEVGLGGGLVAVIIVIGTLEMLLEALAGTELREQGVLFFSGLTTWNQIERYVLEDRHSTVRLAVTWSSGLHLYLRRYPPLVRVLFGGSIPEKRISVVLKRDADCTHLEAILRHRAHLDQDAVPAPTT